MKYLKNLLYSLRLIVLIYIIQYLIVFLCSAIYSSLGCDNLTSFISSELSIILTIVNLITVIILIKKYHIPNNKLKLTSYYPLITLGISLSCLCNMLIFLITPSQETTIPIYISIISSGIIGPILEEILFRYILIKDLNKFNYNNISLIIATIIFAIIHITPIKILYTLILGLILNLIYQKYNNIKANILIHMSANIIAIFLYSFNIYILLLSLISLILSSTLLYKE